MNILVVNGSPKGEYSITLQTVRYLERLHPEHSFDVLHVGQRIKALERDFSQAITRLQSADLLLFAYPVYTFIAPSQLHRFIELVKESGVSLAGKAATQITTSKHFYDVTAHRYIQDNCGDLGLRFIRGLSADMDDLLCERGQKEARAFFDRVLWCMEKGVFEPSYGGGQGGQGPRPTPNTQDGELASAHEAAATDAGAGHAAEPFGVGAGHCPAASDAGAGHAADPFGVGARLSPAASDAETERAPEPFGVGAGHCPVGDVVIVADLGEDAEVNRLSRMIDRFRAVLPYKTRVVDIAKYPFKGGCLGCFNCATDGTCVYKDGFDTFLRGEIQTAQAIVYAFTVRDHSMGARMKLYDDRQFCNGHRTVTMGMPMGYLVSGPYSREMNLQMIVEGRAQVGGNFLAGVATDEHYTTAQIDALAASLAYAIERKYTQPQNFYGVGGMKIFRDLIYQMRGMMKADHRFYKAHGQYDFPQKQKGTILKMYAVGALLSSPKLRAKMGGKMNEGMIAPYKKVLDSIRKEG